MMHLFELQASDIDKNLKNTASNIGNQSVNQQFSQNPQQNPADQQNPAEPQNQADIPGNDTLPDDDDEMTKAKVDDYLLTSVKHMEYVSNYEHNEHSKINPYRILTYNLADLENLRLMTKNKMNSIMFTDGYGLYNDPSMKFYTDLLAYTEKVIQIKKQLDKEAPSKSEVKKPTYDKAKTSKLNIPRNVRPGKENKKK